MDNDLFNNWAVRFFYFSMLIYPLSMIMTLALQRLVFDYLAGKSIYICYGLVYLFASFLLVRFGFSLKRLSTLYLIYVLYLVLFLTSAPTVRSVYTGVVMIMIYIYYLPYSVLILSRIVIFLIYFLANLLSI